MQTELSIKLSTLRYEGGLIKLAERHQINNMRKMLGTWWDHHKRHKKDEPRPERPDHEVLPEESARYAKEAEDRYWNLTHHRQNIVRRATRHSHVALGFLRGRSFKTLEQTAYSQPDWVEVEKIAQKHYEGDSRTFLQTFGEWMAEAKAHYSEHGNLNVTV